MKIIIFTPLELEYLAIRTNLSELEKIPVNGIVYEKGIFKGSYLNYEVILCQAGVTNKVMGIAVERAIQYFQPSLAILSGIAGGVKDVSLGSVIVGLKVYDYESGKETENGYVARPESINFSPDLISFAQSIAKDQKWKASLKTEKEDPQVFFGAIAAGEKVIASTDSELYKRIKKYFNDTLAVEMEAFGFAKALENHPFVKSLCVRGISDLLDNKSDSDKEGSQPIAARHAAGFIFELLDQLEERYLILPLMEPKKLSSEIFKAVKTALDQDQPLSEASLNLINHIEKVIPQAYKEYVEDQKDEDAPAVFRSMLRKKMNSDDELVKVFSNLLNLLNSMKNQGTTNQNTTIKDNEIKQNKGNIAFGNQTNTTNDLKNNQGTIYIADTINIKQILQDTPKAEKVVKEEGFETIRSLIAQNKIKLAIEALLIKTNNSNEKNSTILFASRWNDLQRQKRNKLITSEQNRIEHNLIVIGVLELLDDLEI